MFNKKIFNKSLNSYFFSVDVGDCKFFVPLSSKSVKCFFAKLDFARHSIVFTAPKWFGFEFQITTFLKKKLRIIIIVLIKIKHFLTDIQFVHKWSM